MIEKGGCKGVSFLPFLFPGPFPAQDLGFFFWDAFEQSRAPTAYFKLPNHDISTHT